MSAWALGAAFSACAEAMPPSQRAAQETAVVAVALLPPSAAREAGAGKPRPNPAPGPGPAGMPKTHDGSHIPTPIDNPWALCLLAALVARMLWMDRPPRPDKN